MKWKVYSLKSVIGCHAPKGAGTNASASVVVARAGGRWAARVGPSACAHLNGVRDDAFGVVEGAHLADDAHDHALLPLRTTLREGVILLLIDPHPHRHLLGAVVERVHEVCGLLVSGDDQANDGHLVQLAPVEHETLLAARVCRSVLQLLYGDRDERLPVLVALSLREGSGLTNAPV